MAAGRPSLVAIRSLTLGDMLTIIPALRGLRAAFPDATRYLTVAPWIEPLTRHLDLADVFVDSAPDIVPDPTDIVALETGQLTHLAGVPWEPDVAVHFRGYRPVTFHALTRLRPKRLIAYHHPEVPETIGGPVYVHHEHEVTRWSRLMTESGVHCDPADLSIDPPVLDLGSIGGSVVVHPGAGARARYWPAERWARIVRRLSESGHKVAVTGSDHERELAAEVVERADAPAVVDVSGRTSILELTALVAQAPLVVCPDTGVGHLASAVGATSVLLFGPTDPALWGPPAGPHTVLWAGRIGAGYADEPDPGLLELTVTDVWEAIEGVRT